MHAILSLDLGIKNIGYTIISYSKFGKLSFADLNIKFGIYDISENIPKGCNIVNGRCSALHSFFNDIIESYNIDFFMCMMFDNIMLCIITSKGTLLPVFLGL